MDRAFVNLYIASLTNLTIGPVYPEARQAQLDSTQNEKARLQRYAVWKLLQYAVEHSLGLPFQSLTLECDGSKWTCKECFFSLSHCDGAVAVAVSDKPVGVDIEPAGRQISPGIARKILTEGELSVHNALPEENQRPYLLEKWCIKESLFKAGFDGMFHSRREQSSRYASADIISLSGSEYQYAIATPIPEKVSIFTDAEPR